MKDLTHDQVQEVSGGNLALGGLAIFIYHERQQIADFIGGMFDGYHGTELMRPD